MPPITISIRPELYGSFQQGSFEPTDLLENGPQKLYVLCLKFIVKNIIRFDFECRIPSDICDNLIEVCGISSYNLNINTRNVGFKSCRLNVSD